jgi:2-oxoisovalerate dehydrogenase E1 component
MPATIIRTPQEEAVLTHETLLKAWELMCTAKAMTEHLRGERKFTSKYVHATSRGHEAIQLALGLQLKPQDFVAPYYRDDSILLGIGMRPYELMLQLMAKRDDPFSGGRTYYGHPSLRRDDMPKIPHQSSATGMQAIPTTGIALGMWYKEKAGIAHDLYGAEENPVVVCSIGDAAITEGEVAEALQMAVLKKLPIIYLVQDNEWDISASADEIRAGDASDYAQGFKGLGSAPSGWLRLHRLPRLVARGDRHRAQGASALPDTCQGAPAEPPHQRGAHGILPDAREPGRAPQTRSLPHDSCSNCSTCASNWKA